MAKEKIANIYLTRKQEPHLDGRSLNLEDFYVPTGLSIANRYGGKKSIPSTELFKPGKDAAVVKTVLIEGDSGTGKSTFTEELLYLLSLRTLQQSSDDSVLPKEIEYGFKIKLKLLLSNNWKSNYRTDDLDDPLACFIHYSLSQYIDRKTTPASKRVSLSEISSILENYKDKILLIADGYDEIARSDERNPEVRGLLDEIFSNFKHVIMTSRPNFLSILRENQFDRKVETIGLDGKSIGLFIEKYFKTQHDELIKILNNYFEAHEAATGNDLFHHLRASTNPLDLEALLQLHRVVTFIQAKIAHSSNPSSMAAVVIIQAHFNNKVSITQSIDSYYQDTERDLRLALANPTVKSLASNPMNAAMLCLAFSDPETHIKLKDNFTINELYRGVLALLGKKFISQIQSSDGNEEAHASDLESLLNLPEFQALREIAYNTLINGDILTGEEINSISERFGSNIEKVYKSGLLKVANKKTSPISDEDEADNHIMLPSSPSSPEGISDGVYATEDSDPLLLQSPLPNDLIAQEHIFVNPSFQEYLAAFDIKRKLMSQDPKIYMEPVKLIAYHRNEPQYLTLLKFIAGILSNLPQTQEANLAITRFWEAIECNVDGVLELGKEKKVILFMHLLSQTKKDGIIDPRIPNRDKVIGFIDEVVLNSGDFIKWQEKIRVSDYLSEEMESFLWESLENKHLSSRSFSAEIPSAIHSLAITDSFFDLSLIPVVHVEVTDEIKQDDSPLILSVNSDDHSPRRTTVSTYVSKKKAIIEIAGSILNRIDNSRLFKALLNNLEDITDWHIVKSSINVITKIIKYQEVNFSPEDTILAIEKLIPFIKDPNLNGSAINALRVFVNINIRDTSRIELILTDLINLVREGIYEPTLNQLIYDTIFKSNDSILNFSLETLIPLIQSEDSLSLSPTRGRSRSSGEELAQQSAYTARDIALKIIEDLIKANKDNAATLAVDKLIQILHVETSQNSISLAIGKFLMISGYAVQQDVFIRIIANLHDDGTKAKVIDAMNAVIRPNEQMSSEFAERILNELASILIKEDIINKNNIINVIIKVAKIAESISEEMRATIFNVLLSKSITPAHELQEEDTQSLIDRHSQDQQSSYRSLKMGEVAAYQDYPDSLLALAHIVPVSMPEHVKQVFTLVLNKIGQEGHSSLVAKEALITLTNRNIDSELAQYIFTNLIPLLENKLDFVATAIANLARNLYISDQDLEFIGNKLITQLGDESTYSSIISAIEMIINSKENIKFLYITKLLDFLENFSTTLHINIECNIISLITKIDNINEYPFAERILHYSFSLLTKEGCNGIILAKAISKLSPIFPTQIENLVSTHLMPLLANERDELVTIATLTLSKIIKHQTLPSINKTSLLDKMIGFLNDHENSLNALRVIILVLKRETDVTLIKDTTDRLIELMYGNTQEAAYCAYIISKLIDKVAITDETLNLTLSKLKLIHHNSPLSVDVKASMNHIIESMSLKSSIAFLKTPCPIIREVTIEVITRKLLAVEIGDSWTTSIKNMLYIIGNDIETSDPNLIRLYDVTRRVLQNLCKTMDLDERNLKWINEHFNELIKISKAESESMMEALFYYVLSDNKITAEESKFIVLCITKIDSTATFSISPNGTIMIQYARKIYTLQGETNHENVEAIANAVLSRKDLLVQQYIDHKPLFPNSGSGMMEAAIDIFRCVSVISGDLLFRDTVKFSYLYLSDNEKSTLKKSFALLEQRDAGGYFIVHVISISSSGEAKVTMHKQHPNRLDSDFREKIFGKMDDYEETKPRYYSSQTFDISVADATKMLDAIAQDRSSVQHVPQKKMHHRSWSIAVLQISDSKLSAAQDSPVLTKRSALNKKADLNEETSKKLHAFIQQFIDLDSHHISSDWIENLAHFTELRRDQLVLIDLERQTSNQKLLKELLHTDTLKHKALEKMEARKQDPYKWAAYLEIKQMLLSVYIAALSDKSGMVSTQDSDSSVGLVGSAVGSVSSYVPVVGAGVAILGQILEGLSEALKEEKIKNFLRFFDDLDEVKIIAERIASEVVDLNIVVSQNSLDPLISTFKQVLQGGVSTLASKAASAAIDMMSEEEDPRTLAGESDGAAIAQFIIRRIFDGEYKDFIRKRHFIKGSVEKDKALTIIADVKVQFVAITEAPEDSVIDSSQITLTHLLADAQPKKTSTTITDKDSGNCHCIIMRVELAHYTNPLFNSKEYQAIFTLPKEEMKEALKVFCEYAHSISPQGKDDFLTIFSRLYLQSSKSLQLTIEDKPLEVESFAIIPLDISSRIQEQNALEVEDLNIHTLPPTPQHTNIGNNPGATSFSLFSFSDILNPGFLLKKLFYQNDLQELYAFLNNKGIKVDINSEKDLKQIFLKIHSDKGGSDKDFIFVNGIRDKLKQDLWQDLYKAFESQFKNIESALHTTSISFKSVDTAVDTARFVKNPTINNGKSLLLDLNYLYVMKYGSNKISLAINSADILYKASQGKFIEASTQAVITGGYMLVPTVIAAVGGPYATLTYSVIITGHTGYKALNNALSFWDEYSAQVDPDSMMLGTINSAEVIE